MTEKKPNLENAIERRRLAKELKNDIEKEFNRLIEEGLIQKEIAVNLSKRFSSSLIERTFKEKWNCDDVVIEDIQNDIIEFREENSFTVSGCNIVFIPKGIGKYHCDIKVTVDRVCLYLNLDKLMVSETDGTKKRKLLITDRNDLSIQVSEEELLDFKSWLKFWEYSQDIEEHFSDT